MPTDLAPLKIAVVRFSALGDLVMVSTAVRRLRQCLPNAEITWITSPLGQSLLQGMEGVNFEVHAKPRTLADYRAFYRHYRARRFDIVLAMQANLRINLLYPALKAPLKIGFDRVRAREGQWLFTNRQIPFADTHLVDSFLAFVQAAGATTDQPAEWKLPVSAEDYAWADAALNGLPRPLIALHPVASKTERNWLPERYREVMRLAAERWQTGFVLTGGNSAAERALCAELAASQPGRALDLSGQSTPKQLTAVLARADVLIAPDTGPVHLANAMGTPVVGLYAVAPASLTGPYCHLEFVVDRYPQAVRQFLHKSPEELPWNTRVHHPDAMALIEVDDVMAQLARALEAA